MLENKGEIIMDTDTGSSPNLNICLLLSHNYRPHMKQCQADIFPHGHSVSLNAAGD